MVSQYFFNCQKNVFRENWKNEEIRAMGFERWLYEHPTWIWNEEKEYPGVPRLQERDQSWWYEGCDFVGRFERLYEDAIFIQQKIDTRPAQLNVINDSRHKDYRAYYTPEMVDFVQKHHEKTIDKFNYDFENIHRF